MYVLQSKGLYSDILLRSLFYFGGHIQGVPKVHSSNFMYYNFWSKLYFDIKFLEDLCLSVEYMYSEFQ